jgi:hypothetical protein
VVGGIVFLLALLVKSSTYDQIGVHQANAKNTKAALLEDPGPSKKSITAQKTKASEAKSQTKAMAEKVASMASGDAYARESIEWTLANIGLPGQADQFFTLYKELPQNCLSRLREEARGVLVGKAARMGKEIPENQGISGNFEDNEVRLGLHGLGIVSDLVNRCLDSDGIDAIEHVKISPRPRRRVGNTDQSGARATVFSVSMKVRGDPDAVNALLRSFNTQANYTKRLTVVDRIEFVQRVDKEHDPVRASFDLFGIQYHGIDAGAGGE